MCSAQSELKYSITIDWLFHKNTIIQTFYFFAIIRPLSFFYSNLSLDTQFKTIYLFDCFELVIFSLFKYSSY